MRDVNLGGHADVALHADRCWPALISGVPFWGAIPYCDFHDEKDK